MKSINWKYEFNRTHIYLGLILLLGSFLRLYKLDFQSPWLDELHTLIECDPVISWAETFKQVSAYEGKGPLYFIIVKLVFTLSSYSTFVARLLSALAGIISIYFMFCLGKEIFTSRSGLFAALLTAINPFHLLYSQEARGYIFIFLFTVLSTLYLIKLIKYPKIKNAIYFGLFSILTMHIHTFGFLVVASQGLCYVYYLAKERIVFTVGLKYLITYFSVLLIGAIPLIASLFSLAKVTSSWIPMPQPDFYTNCFFEFFGNNSFLNPILLLSVLFYFLYVLFYSGSDTSEKIVTPLQFFFISNLVLFLFCILLPYYYSIYKTPIVVSRYFTVALPGVLLAIALAFSFIKNKDLACFFAGAFFILSLSDTIFFKNYYTGISKTQFRELSEFIRDNNERNCVIVNQKTAWHQGYFLSKFNLSSNLISLPKQTFVDSLIKQLNENKPVNLKGFWLVGAHSDPKPSFELTQQLNANFILAKSQDFYDAWAYLYYLKPGNSKSDIKLTPVSFKEVNVAVIEGDSVVTLWDDEFRDSRKILMPEGKFQIALFSRGTPFESICPHLNVYVNDMKIGSFFTEKFFSLSPSFTFNQLKTDSVGIRVKMDNDQNSPTSKEDRNAFIKSIYFSKK